MSDYNSLAEKGVPLLQEALRNKRNPAMTRGFLYICMCQTDAIRQFQDSMSDQFCSNIGANDIMAMGLLELVHCVSTFEYTIDVFKYTDQKNARIQGHNAKAYSRPESSSQWNVSAITPRDKRASV